MDENENYYKINTLTSQNTNNEINKENTQIQSNQPQNESEELVKNPFSADFVRNFDSQKEFQKQHEVYARQTEPNNPISAKVVVNQTKISETTPQKETVITNTKTVIETPNFDLIKVKESGLKFDEKKKIKKKFRLKLIAGVYCFIFAICAGWVVYNSIEINNANYQIVQYLVKIDQLDTANKVQTEDGSIINVVVPIEPNALAEPTETQPQTNWFDKFCNFIAKIFK